MSTSGIYPERQRRAHRHQPAGKANFVRPAANYSSGPPWARAWSQTRRVGRWESKKLAGDRGFEPRLPDPESGVIPLDQSPPESARTYAGGRPLKGRQLRLYYWGALAVSRPARLAAAPQDLPPISELPRFKPFRGAMRCTSGKSEM